MIPDVAIVGAGIVGAACAYYLRCEGLEVAVLDRCAPASGVTGAGMGHLVVMDDSPTQLAFTAWSVGLWEELLGDITCEAERPGTLWLAANEGEWVACAAKREVYRAAGVEAELVDAKALRAIEPILRHDLVGALRVPGDRVIYAPKACVGLLQMANVNVERREVTNLDEIEAGQVVVATGASTKVFLPQLPVVPRKGHLAVTDRYPGLLRHQLVELGYLSSAHGDTGPSVAFNLQPRATGQIVIGSSREFVGWDGAVRCDILGRMMARATEIAPGLAKANVIRTWTGFRPATPDHLPIIGRVAERTWVAAGHEGLGITTATGTGRLIAEMLTGRPISCDPSPFSPGRFDGHV